MKKEFSFFFPYVNPEGNGPGTVPNNLFVLKDNKVKVDGNGPGIVPYEKNWN